MCHHPNRGTLPYAILDNASQSVTANNRCGIVSALAAFHSLILKAAIKKLRPK